MTNDIVIDASALVEALGSANPHQPLIHRILTSRLFAPEVLILETLSAFAKHVRRGEMDLETAGRAVSRLSNLPVARSSHEPFMTRIWELRHSISVYDAAYIALAEELDAPLVTCDAKLAGSNSHNATIELYPPS
ncbi:Toxin 1, PIN domain [Alloactinosynnema sp. L-07]|uniref:type II toxin-antitoxin system VapC family toxin n=1 Tax=Alloactinosynnema sp. L-07 TaxID=1653480 RepID=UPI00065EF2FF|nr:type II toxin-antitoxin system VapC family toxin [Alloactinosynnema sp. L-07]CRK58129.1 Toxin 1, PIN domain [Alloactinosynnema sp. L-07]